MNKEEKKIDARIVYTSKEVKEMINSIKKKIQHLDKKVLHLKLWIVILLLNDLWLAIKIFEYSMTHKTIITQLEIILERLRNLA